MHVVFMNPQGNFDPQDSYLTEHPDFGGQLVYVKELAQAMSRRGHKIDIVTRKVQDKSWPEFSSDQDSYPGFEENLRILRFSFGGKKFLKKSIKMVMANMPPIQIFCCTKSIADEIYFVSS